MKTCTLCFALLVAVVLLPAQEAVAQEAIMPKAAVEKLLALGLIERYEIDGTGLVEQVTAGEVEAVKLFLAAGVSPNMQILGDVQQRDILLLAADLGQADVIQALVDAGADLGAKDRVGRTALVIAVIREHDDVVDILLDAQAQQ